MASHISAAPNHQTFRTIPLKFRIDVAMSGRLGMEIQPKNMTEKEKRITVDEMETIFRTYLAILKPATSGQINVDIDNQSIENGG